LRVQAVTKPTADAGRFHEGGVEGIGQSLDLALGRHDLIRGDLREVAGKIDVHQFQKSEDQMVGLQALGMQVAGFQAGQLQG
jgi:hypothetical protein